MLKAKASTSMKEQNVVSHNEFFSGSLKARKASRRQLIKDSIVHRKREKSNSSNSLIFTRIKQERVSYGCLINSVFIFLILTERLTCNICTTFQ